MSFKTPETFVHLQNTNENIFVIKQNSCCILEWILLLTVD